MFLFTLFEITGVIAFAISGALLGIRKGLDLFGVTMLAVTTALGGGIIRDIVIGNTPPVSFKEPLYFVLSLVSAIFAMLAYNKLNRLSNIILIFDAIGLGVFAGVGAKIAVTNSIGSPFIVVSLGLLTGIGGSILRDVFIKEIPYVFRKEIYAIAAIIGSLVFYYSRFIFPEGNIALYLCAIVTVSIRFIAIHKQLDLPSLDKIIDKR